MQLHHPYRQQQREVAMKEYEKLPKELRQKLEMICALDPYGLSPQTLYRNIYNSSGTIEQLARLFEVPPSLVQEIKEQR